MRNKLFFDNSITSQVRELSKVNELVLPKIVDSFELAKIGKNLQKSTSLILRLRLLKFVKNTEFKLASFFSLLTKIVFQ